MPSGSNPAGGAYSLLAEISNSIKLLTKKSSKKSILELETPINIISGGVQDNLCLSVVIALCMACFCMAKINKKLSPLL